MPSVVRLVISKPAPRSAWAWWIVRPGFRGLDVEKGKASVASAAASTGRSSADAANRHQLLPL